MEIRGYRPNFGGSMRHILFGTIAACLVFAATPSYAENHYLFDASHQEVGVRAYLLFDNTKSVEVEDTGWIRSSGEHNSDNPNYATGFTDQGGEYRSFFNFNFGSQPPFFPYTSATLTIKTGLSVGTGPFDLTLYDVSAGLLDLDQDRNPGDIAGQALFADLGTGSSYGSISVPGPTNFNQTISITLNSFFVEQINSGALSNFSIGGRLAPAGVGDSAVPEPASWTMMIGGFGWTGAAMRRRRKVPFAACRFHGASIHSI